ncbi:MAG: heavy metal-binding domain-containing protein [Hungatella sp.]|nr:heavy metal-binding domain-containing protein [Hungatella sp.]
MKCIKCGAELTSEMFACGMCFSCGCSISESKEAFEMEQSKIKAEADLAIQQQNQQRKEELAQKLQEEQRIYAERLKNHMLTTGFSFEGYSIAEYLGIVTGETVVGTGYFSDIGASISDFFGAEAPEYSQKLRVAKQAVLNIMIKNSTDLGGNAIIGISFELMTFSGNMMGVSVTGTSVKVNKHSDNA